MSAAVTSFPHVPSSVLGEEEQITTTKKQDVRIILAEKIQQGYTLMQSACPSCHTPLVKNEKSPQNKDSSNCPESSNFPIIVSSESFEQPFIPVMDVPFCVSCQAHVVTSPSDLDRLDSSESFKDKGSILVSMAPDETSSGEDIRDDVGVETKGNSYDVERTESEKPPEAQENGTQQALVNTWQQKMGMVDPNRFSTTLFCGTTSSRQVPSPSALNDDETENSVTESKNCDNNAERNTPSAPSTPPSSYNNIADEEEQKGDAEVLMMECSVRRQMATQILGKRMLDGYTLRDISCQRCSMPLMEKNRVVSCVVCPELFGDQAFQEENSVGNRWAKEVEFDSEEEEKKRQKAEAAEKARVLETEKERAAKEHSAKKSLGVQESPRIVEAIEDGQTTSARTEEASTLAKEAAARTAEIIRLAEEVTTQENKEAEKAVVEQASARQLTMDKADEAARKAAEEAERLLLQAQEKAEDEIVRSTMSAERRVDTDSPLSPAEVRRIESEAKIALQLVEEMREKLAKQEEEKIRMLVELEKTRVEEVNRLKEEAKLAEEKAMKMSQEEAQKVIAQKEKEAEAARLEETKERLEINRRHLEHEELTRAKILAEAEELRIAEIARLKGEAKLAEEEAVRKAQEEWKEIMLEAEKKATDEKQLIEEKAADEAKNIAFFRSQAELLLKESRQRLLEQEAEKELLLKNIQKEKEAEARKAEAAILAERMVVEVEVTRLAELEAEKIALQTREKAEEHQRGIEIEAETEILKIEEARKAEVDRLEAEAEVARKACTDEEEQRKVMEKLLEETRERLEKEEEDKKRIIAETEAAMKNESERLEKEAKAAEDARIEAALRSEEARVQLEELREKLAAAEAEKESILNEMREKLAAGEAEKDRLLAESKLREEEQQRIAEKRLEEALLKEKAEREEEVGRLRAETEEAREKVKKESGEKELLLQAAHKAAREAEEARLSEIAQLEQETRSVVELHAEGEKTRAKESQLLEELREKLAAEEEEKARLLADAHEAGEMAEKRRVEDLTKEEKEKMRLLAEANKAAELAEKRRVEEVNRLEQEVLIVKEMRVKDELSRKEAERLLEEIRQRLAEEEAGKCKLLADAEVSAQEFEDARLAEVALLELGVKAAEAARLAAEQRAFEEQQKLEDIRQKLVAQEAEKIALYDEAQRTAAESSERSLSLERLQEDMEIAEEARKAEELRSNKVQEELEETRQRLALEESERVRSLAKHNDEARAAKEAAMNEISRLKQEVAAAEEARKVEELRRLEEQRLLEEIQERLAEEERERIRLLTEAKQAADEANTAMATEVSRLESEVESLEKARLAAETRGMVAQDLLKETKQRLMEEESSKQRLVEEAKKAAAEEANALRMVEVSKLEKEIESLEKARLAAETKGMVSQNILQQTQQRLTEEEAEKHRLVAEAQMAAEKANQKMMMEVARLRVEVENMQNEKALMEQKTRLVEKERLKEEALWKLARDNAERTRSVGEAKALELSKLTEQVEKAQEKRLMKEAQDYEERSRIFQQNQAMERSLMREAQEEKAQEEQRLMEEARVYEERSLASKQAQVMERSLMVEVPEDEYPLVSPASQYRSPVFDKKVTKNNYQAKRDYATKEIGKKISEGWVLLDLSCPQCVMPLLNDGKGGQEICVLCDPATEGKKNVHATDNRFHHFSFHEEVDKKQFTISRRFDEEQASVTPKAGSKKPKTPSVEVNPEKKMPPSPGMSIFRTKKSPSPMTPKRQPPRPEGGTIRSESPRIQSLTKKSRTAIPMKSSFGADETRDDISMITDAVSKCDDSVATEALDMLVNRMDQCKNSLSSATKSKDDGSESALKKQMEVANLLEKLAAAALAVKQLEDVDDL